MNGNIEPQEVSPKEESSQNDLAVKFLASNTILERKTIEKMNLITGLKKNLNRAGVCIFQENIIRRNEPSNFDPIYLFI